MSIKDQIDDIRARSRISRIIFYNCDFVLFNCFYYGLKIYRQF